MHYINLRFREQEEKNKKEKERESQRVSCLCSFVRVTDYYSYNVLFWFHYIFILLLITNAE